MIKIKIISLLLSIIIIASIGTVGKINIESVDKENDFKCNNFGEEFYFVQVTDTHVMHGLFDRAGNTKMRLTSVLDNISSFEEKPAFVAITGDLVEWGGSGAMGALNYQAFVDCLFEKDGRFYADSECTIPIYTTPGNHDYVWENNLWNYHKYIDLEDRYTITIGDTTFFFMDSGANYILEPWDWILILGAGLFDDDINWFENQLSSCQSKYKIILMHHPAVSKRTEFGRMEDVIARNRENFIDLCEQNDVELVLTGHTHSDRIYDSDENFYDALPLNCNDYPTLYVQTDDCKQGIHYRNVSITDEGVILEHTQELEYNPNNKPRNRANIYLNILMDILKNR